MNQTLYRAIPCSGEFTPVFRLSLSPRDNAEEAIKGGLPLEKIRFSTQG